MRDFGGEMTVATEALVPRWEDAFHGDAEPRSQCGHTIFVRLISATANGDAASRHYAGR